MIRHRPGRAPRGIRLALVAAGLSMAGGACSGDTASDTTTTTGPPASNVSSTAGPATTTTVPRVGADWEEEAEVADRALAVDGGLVVSVEPDPGDPDAFVVRARGTDGSLRWAASLGDRGPVPRTAGRKAVFTEDLVVVPTVGAGGGRELVAFERTTGEIAWSVEGGIPRSAGRVVDGGPAGVAWLTADGVSGFSPDAPTRPWTAEPTAAERDVVEVRVVGDVALATTRTSTVAFDLVDGTRRWDLDEVVLDAVAGPDGSVVTVASLGGATGGVRLRWLDLATGDERWTATSPLGPTNFVGTAVDEGLLVLVVGRTTEAYRLGGGTSALWDTTAAVTFGGHSSPPLALDGLVAVAGSGSRLSGPQGGYVEVYDATDGALRRQAFTDAEPGVLLDGGGGRVLTVLGEVPARGGAAAVPARIVALPLLERETPTPPIEEPESALLGIPTPGEAVTPKNLALAAGLLALLSVLVMIPTTLFNSALETVLHGAHERWERWSRPRDGGSLPLWARPPGVVLYLVASAFLYSWLQPDWGANWATWISASAFLVTLALTTALSLAMTVVGLRRRPEGADGHPVVEFRTLLIAGLCVLGSRLIGFVPGYLYGIVARYEPDVEPSESEQAATIRRTSVVVLAVSLGAWFLVGPLRDAAEGRHPLVGLPAAVAAGVFMGGVESLMIGLLPLELLPGSALRRHHRHWWKLLWAAGGFLTALVLFRPGLVSAQSRSAWLTLAAAVVYSGGAVGFWAIARRLGDVSGPPAPAAGTPASEDAAPEEAGVGSPPD